MKQQKAPKWLLMTALLAVLGANYSFQSSSLTIAQAENNGVFELSLEAAPATSRTATASAPVAAGRTRRGTRTATTSATTTVSAPATVSATSRTFSLKTPEGQVVATGTCQGCSDAILDLAAIKKIALATGVVSATASTAQPAAAAVASAATSLPLATSEYDCDFTEDGKPETNSQKRERLRCEKKEKERIRTEERTAKFEDRMEDIKERCSDSRSEEKIECLTREFGNALTRYSGRNALPQNLVQRYFKNIVGPELSKVLFNSDYDMSKAMGLLQDVFDGMPSEYSGLRQNVLNAIQNQTKTQADAINQKFKDADTFAKLNKPAEYLQTMREAQAAQTELTQMSQAYSAAARTSDAFGEDMSFAKYYQMTYSPQMNKILAGIGPVAASTTVTPEKPSEGGTRQNTRGGGTGTTVTPVTRGQATTNTGFKVDGTPSQWEFLNNGSSGVRVGAPTPTPAPSGRGARSMNN